MNKKYFFLIISAIFIFLFYSQIFLPPQGLLVFDTLREYEYSSKFFSQSDKPKLLDWNMSLFNGILSNVTGIDLYYISYYGGFFITFLSAVFFYRLSKNLTKSNNLSIFATFLFLIYTDIISATFYYRPQTLALLYFILFVNILSKSSQNLKSVNHIILISAILSLGGLSLHKTTKILPIIFAIFWGFFTVYTKNKKSFLLSLFLSLIILLASLNPLFNFINFYLSVGMSLDPAAFTQGVISLNEINSKTGFFLTAIIFLGFFKLILETRKRVSKNILPGFSLVLFFCVTFFSFAYLLPKLGILSVNTNRFFLFLFPFTLLSLFCTKDYLEYRNLRYLFIFFVIFCFVSIFPPDISETSKVTADKKYLDELTTLPFKNGDVIFSTFSSSPALKSSIIGQNNLSEEEFYILSGYHNWGAESFTTMKVREGFLANNLKDLTRLFCESIDYEIEYLSSVPKTPVFLTPSEEEYEEIVKVLAERERVLIFISFFDMEIRPESISNDPEVNNWWDYRTVKEIRGKNINFGEEIYLSKKIGLYKLDLKC